MSGHAHGPSMASTFILLGSTFLFGFVTGVIIFLMSNTGREGDGGITEPQSGFVVTAHMYGGCERDTLRPCSSYQILEDGSYTFIGFDAQGNQKQFRDTLSGSERRALRSVIEKSDLAALEASKLSGTCSLATTGIAFRYSITTRQGVYQLDTCTHALPGTELFTILDGHFRQFMQQYPAQ